MKRSTYISGGVIVILIILLAVANSVFTSVDSEFNGNGEKVIVYKTATCGCCANYVAYLKKRGFEVEAENVRDLDAVKAEQKVPASLASCHTSLIGGYVVEGHIPTEVIAKLLQERPDIAGIALAGMPDGSPGMPGTKRGTFAVRKITQEGTDGGTFWNY